MNIISQSGIPSLTVGGRYFPNPSTLLILGGSTGAGSLDYCCPRKQDASAAAVATGGGTMVRAIRWITQAANLLVEMGYCDNDVGFATATVPTNPVWAFRDQILGANQSMSGATQTYILNELADDFKVPAGKYLFVKSNNAQTQYRFFCEQL